MKKNPKNLVTLMLTLALIAALAGCSGGNAPEVPAESGVTNDASDTPGATEDDNDATKTPDASPDDNDTEELQREADYEDAKAALESGDFAAASRAFAELGDYKDAGELRKEADYGAATEMLESGDYSAATEAFVALGDYKDSATLAANGSLYPYAGIYRNGMGDVFVLEIIDSALTTVWTTFGGERVLELDINNVQDNGAIRAHSIYETGTIDTLMNLSLYPVGIPLLLWDDVADTDVETDAGRIRLFITYGSMPDIKTNVYYKIEPLKAGELSYLPTPGNTHEFSYGGVYSGTGEEWEVTRVLRFEEADDGGVKVTIVSITENGSPVSTAGLSEYFYFEDETGLYS